MAFDVNFAIQVMLPAAQAAYAIQTNNAPALPAGYALVGPIMANPGRAAVAMAAATPVMQGLMTGMLAESPIFGLVAWNAAQTTALVAIRGTQTLEDWGHNLDALAVPCISVPGAGDVHMGFQLVYEHIAASIRGLLQTGCPGMTQILVTGHSLGGAVAILAGLDIKTNMGFGITPLMYTFAGPRVGSPGYVATFNGGIPVLFRVVNFGDLVPQVPLPPIYIHAGTEQLVTGGFSWHDPAVAHSLTTYLAGLQALPAA
jgi:hypothetical protein